MHSMQQTLCTPKILPAVFESFFLGVLFPLFKMKEQLGKRKRKKSSLRFLRSKWTEYVEIRQKKIYIHFRTSLVYNNVEVAHVSRRTSHTHTKDDSFLSLSSSPFVPSSYVSRNLDRFALQSTYMHCVLCPVFVCVSFKIFFSLLLFFVRPISILRIQR